jgi:hypothetical protein
MLVYARMLITRVAIRAVTRAIRVPNVCEDCFFEYRGFALPPPLVGRVRTRSLFWARDPRSTGSLWMRRRHLEAGNVVLGHRLTTLRVESRRRAWISCVHRPRGAARVERGATR